MAGCSLGVARVKKKKKTEEESDESRTEHALK